MKKILSVGILSILFLIVDNAVIPFIAIKGFYPSLLLVFALSYSIINGKWEGLWIGVFTGVLQDVFFGVGFGINSLTNMLLCVIAGEIGINILKAKSLIPIGSSLILSLLKGLMIIAVLYVFGIYVSFYSVIFTSVYNMVISIFMYKAVYRLCQKDFMQKRWKF